MFPFDVNVLMDKLPEKLATHNEWHSLCAHELLSFCVLSFMCEKEKFQIYLFSLHEKWFLIFIFCTTESYKF